MKTQLHIKNNKSMLEYFDEVSPLFNVVFRKTFHLINQQQLKNVSKYNTYLQKTYNISKRTSNSIIKYAQGRYNSIKELKKYELTQSKHRLYKLQSDKDKLNHTLIPMRQSTAGNLLTTRELVKYRNLKRKVSWLKIKINRLQNKIKQLAYELKVKRFKICFGSKKLLNKSFKKFIAQRDKQMMYVGSKDETCNNQVLQLTYNKQNNQFNIKIRKDFQHKNDKEKYLGGRCYFNHHKKQLINHLRDKTSPLTYTISREGGRYYLSCIFSVDKTSQQMITQSNQGVIGIDFNKGFLAITETNQQGHMVNGFRLNYRYGSGNKTQSDLERCLTKIKEYSLTTGKDVVIEDLDFIRKKSKQTKSKSNRGKKYNKMLSTLAYRKFIRLSENVLYRNGIKLIKVNPAWTSWLAKKKYCDNMKLNIHQGASFVVARKGQGFKEKL